MKIATIAIGYADGFNRAFGNGIGEVLVNGKLVIDHQLVVFDTKNTEIEIIAQADARFIFGSGDAIDEPMVAQGPFVMNTTTEIMQAMRDYQMGKMGVM